MVAKTAVVLGAATAAEGPRAEEAERARAGEGDIVRVQADDLRCDIDICWWI